MATYFVKNGGSGASPTTDPGTSGTWTGAYATLGAAVTAATADGDTIKVSDEDVEALSAAVTYTIAADINIIVVDHQNTATPSTMDTTNYYIGNKATAYTIAFTSSSARKVFIHGLSLWCFGLGQLSFRGNGTSLFLSSVAFRTGSGTINQLAFGGTDFDCYIYAENCTHTLTSTSAASSVTLSAKVELVNWVVLLEGDSPLSYVKAELSDPGGAEITFIGCDLSGITSTIFGNTTASAPTANLINCKLHSTATVLGTQTSKGRAGWDVNLYNCASGDEHYHFAHHNTFGSTVVSTGIYANDGAEWNDAAAKYSWKIVTGSTCSYYTPYVSPLIHQHHEGTSAITPSLECLRDNSSGAVFQNDEVWGEFSYQGSSGFTLGTIVNDRMALLGSPADQTASSKGASDWTGETGTAGFFKLNPTSTITPQEIGNLSARVCVGEPSITVYVDPQIRT